MAEFFLYVHEYFVKHEVVQRAIYANNLEAAVVIMNQYYKKVGVGNDHKSLQRNITGITINDEYYPPTKEWTPPLK